MAIELVDAVNFDGLFDILGSFFFHVETLNIARLTTVPATSQAAVAKFGNYATPNVAMNAAISRMSQGLQNWQRSGNLSASEAQKFAETYLLEIVNIDSPQNVKARREALEYLIADMITQDYKVDANAIGLSLAADAGNSATDLILAYSTKRGDGQVQQHTLAEVIQAKVTSTAPTTTPTVKFTSPLAVGNKLSQDWPGGSGISLSLSAVDAASSLISNGDFQDATISNLPDNWLYTVGLLGTDIVLTVPEVQRITVTGPPTAGYWFIKYTNADSIVRMTGPLAYNASGAEVQAALQALPDLESVTVSTTGTTPLFTHDITFTGLAGNVTALSIVNMTTGGTYTPSEVTAGSTLCYKGVGLTLVGDGATKPVLIQQLPTLTPDTVYFVHYRHKKTGTPAAGVVRIAVLDGIGGSVTTDAEGNANSATYDLTATLTTSFASGWFSFRVKKSQSQPVYLVIEETTAISAGTSYCIDEVAVAAGSKLYKGGPYVAAFSGKTAPIEGDLWTLTATNDRAGEFQTFWDRFFDMAGLELLLPTTGSTLIPDSLIA